MLVQCERAGLSKKGRVMELKTKLVGNFLRKATAHQILNADAEEVWNVGELKTKDCCQPGTVVGNMLMRTTSDLQMFGGRELQPCESVVLAALQCSCVANGYAATDVSHNPGCPWLQQHIKMT